MLSPSPGAAYFIKPAQRNFRLKAPRQKTTSSQGDGPGGARSAARILDVIGADASVDLERRERVEALARAALHRGVIDGEGLKKEEILNMVLHNRQEPV